MTKPDSDIENILFVKPFDKLQLGEFTDTFDFVNFGEFRSRCWLNTPGPIYTTITDNLGLGQVEAINNVGGDEDYREIIFKQPFTKQELKETLNAAAYEPFGSYYFDGNINWNKENILMWLNKSDERIRYVIDRYREELHQTEKHISPFYGPRRAVPENYKYWLDFYQFGMKDYLEWYLWKIHNQIVELPALTFDWSKRTKLDILFILKG